LREVSVRDSLSAFPASKLISGATSAVIPAAILAWWIDLSDDYRKRSDAVRKRCNSNRKSLCNTMREQSDFDDEGVQPRPTLLPVDISGAVNATFQTQRRLAPSLCLQQVRNCNDISEGEWDPWSGGQKRTVQQWLGHSDMESTMRYLKPSRSEKVRDKVNEIFA